MIEKQTKLSLKQKQFKVYHKDTETTFYKCSLKELLRKIPQNSLEILTNGVFLLDAACNFAQWGFFVVKLPAALLNGVFL